MEVEIFQNGQIVKEKVDELSVTDPVSLSAILDLCNSIKKEENQKSILEIILAEICTITTSCVGTIWVSSPKKIHCKYRNYSSDKDKEFPFDSLIKKFPNTNGKVVISNDTLSDARFKRKKVVLKRVKRNMSLPDTKKSKKSSRSCSLFSYSPRCVMIIPLSENIGQLAILAASGKKFGSDDLKNIMIFVSLIEKNLRGNTKTNEIDSIKKSKQTNDVKDIFLATVSHELRTPLNGIVGMVTMLRDAGPLNEKQLRYLTILMECSHQLMNMMNNILDFSKMVSNRFVLSRGPLNVEKSIEDSSMMVEGKIKSKSLDFVKNIQKNIPTLLGDEQRLTQIISNLLSNAVKFTERGFIKLTVDAVSQTLENENTILPIKKWKVNFEIKDTGIGIPKNEQEKVFDVYHQSSNLDPGMIKNGTGLGLSITKELIKMMNGEIEVVSEGIPNKGTIFKFYIIAEEEIKTSDLNGPHKYIMVGSKVLVVDDRPEYRMQLTDMLFKWGCIPTVVSSGEEALQYISHGEVFDTIIVDICMNYMSGVELGQELRANVKTSSIPLIAISSIDLQQGTELFDVYMNKPIDQNHLLPALIKCLIKNKMIKEGKPVGLENIPSSKTIIKKAKRKDLKILIAEDDHNNAFTIKEMLIYLGFTAENIEIVENGNKCVKEAKSNKYNVILMDILMPVMNGLEATKHIRQINPRPYIIAVSASVQNSDKQRCQQVGIDTYLTKPVLKEKLNAALIALVSD